MTEKIRLVPATRRIWPGCIASILLTGLGCVMVHNGHKSGWFFIILFSLGIIAPVLLLRRGASWLELDEEGFTLCLSSKPDRYLWSHISELTIRHGVVSFSLNPEHRGNRRGQTAARTIAGCDGSIPNMFELPPHSLLELMTEFKQKQALQASTAAPGS